MLVVITAVIGVLIVYGFTQPIQYHTSLEQYIVSSNPQTAADVDRLEREYFAQKTNKHII